MAIGPVVETRTIKRLGTVEHGREPKHERDFDDCAITSRTLTVGGHSTSLITDGKRTDGKRTKKSANAEHALAMKRSKSKTEMEDEQENKGLCSCGAPLREAAYNNAPAGEPVWWVAGALRVGSTVFTLTRTTVASAYSSKPPETYTRRFCPKCSVILLDLLTSLGLKAQEHLDARKEVK